MKTKKHKHIMPMDEVIEFLDTRFDGLQYEVDRHWVWITSDLKGDDLKPVRDEIKQIGFRFKKNGDHTCPSGALSRWGHHCQKPTRNKNWKGKAKGNSPSNLVEFPGNNINLNVSEEDKALAALL